MAFGDPDGDGAEETILVTATNTGGSGTFFNLIAASVAIDDIMELEAQTILGDRIRINRMRIVNDTQVELDMVVQGPDDPLCCPTQHVLNTYELQGGEWVLVDEPAISPF
jgi:hypothetical protein